MRFRMKSWALLPVLAVVATVLGACSSMQPVGGAAPQPVPQGEFGGRLTVDGTEVEGLLVLADEEGELRASFRSEGFGIEATGKGRMRDGRLEVTLDYTLDCRGELRLLGPWDQAAGRWTGSLVAADCTGDAPGTFVFVRGAR